jgi:Ni,Fe-hydrogenase maturation factor
MWHHVVWNTGNQCFPELVSGTCQDNKHIILIDNCHQSPNIGSLNKIKQNLGMQQKTCLLDVASVWKLSENISSSFFKYGE